MPPGQNVIKGQEVNTMKTLNTEKTERLMNDENYKFTGHVISSEDLGFDTEEVNASAQIYKHKNKDLFFVFFAGDFQHDDQTRRAFSLLEAMTIATVHLDDLCL